MIKKIFFIAAVLCCTFTISESQAAWWNRFVPQKETSTTTKAQPQDTQYPSLTSPQVEDIKKIISNYLIANPEILVKVSQALQQKNAAAEQSKAQQAIQNHAQALFHNPISPTAGNTQGNVTLVEFFDYQCGHCKNSNVIVKQLIQNNPNLKVIYKELPIFGDKSNLAARSALAASMQGKYSAFHQALFDSPSGINQSAIDAINKTLSIDPSSLSQTQSAQITSELQQNQQLAQALQLRGTPAFIVTNQDNSQSIFIPGAVPIGSLQAAIEKLTPAANPQQTAPPAANTQQTVPPTNNNPQQPENKN